MKSTAPGGDGDAAQSRLQAWRSRRPRAADWVALEAILGFEEFLARARQPPFSRWLAGMSTESTLHEIDRLLRAAFRRDCLAMAGWYPAPWDAALGRLAAAVDLPALAELLRGAEPPRWMMDDPAWLRIARAAPAARFRVATGLDIEASSSAADLLALWIAAWVEALPAGAGAVRAGFEQLARTVLAHRAAGATRARAEQAVPLAERLALLFRRHAGTPVAMAAELAAVMLDLQRLRAGLVRRALARRAATVPA